MLDRSQLVGLAACTRCQKVRGSLEGIAQSVCDMTPRDQQDFTMALDSTPVRLTQAQRDSNTWLLEKIRMRERAAERAAAARSAQGVRA